MPDDELHRFSLEASGLSITVRGDCEQTVAKLNRYLLPWAPRKSSFPGPHDLSFLVTRAESNRFRISLEDRVLSASESMPYLLTLMQQVVDEAFIGRLTDRVAVHAGVVAISGKAIMLPGKSGSGKTSLVRQLLRCGASYFSDEYAIIDSNGLLYPYPRALMVRDENQEQHPVLAAEVQSAGKTPANGDRPITAAIEPAVAGQILFLEYEAGSSFEVHPISHGETLLGLLANTPHVLAEKPEIMAPLVALSRSTVAFEGRRGEVALAADEILRRALAQS
jgi:hypothetical protein